MSKRCWINLDTLELVFTHDLTRPFTPGKNWVEEPLREAALEFCQEFIDKIHDRANTENEILDLRPGLTEELWDSAIWWNEYLDYWCRAASPRTRYATMNDALREDEFRFPPEYPKQVMEDDQVDTPSLAMSEALYDEALTDDGLRTKDREVSEIMEMLRIE